MVAAKPDPTGEKFGKLTVLGKGDRAFKSTNNPKYKSGQASIQLYWCQCECGGIVQKPRNYFDNPSKPNPSCGCTKAEAARRNGRLRAKPDLAAGQRIGMILVLSKAEQKIKDGRYRQFWNFECGYCGQTFQQTRHDVESGKRKSCGCLGKQRRKELVDNKRRPHDISGQRFGKLVAIRLTGKHDRAHKPTWLMQCDCGETSEWSKSKLLQYTNANQQIHCGDRSKHEWGLWYPPTPNPYPQEAGELLEKYLRYTQPQSYWRKVDSRVEDEKRDRLVRVCWILTYRRQQGEEISELRERRYILKSLRFISLKVYWDRKLERCGGLTYTMHGAKKQISIGGEMTNATFHDYPVSESETQGNISLPARELRRVKFKRC